MEDPGALACQFLLAVRAALSMGPATSSRDLNSVDVQRWARDHSSLKELRDSREVSTLMLILKNINEDKLPEAVDVIAQRVKAVLTAKAPKGTWEKAQALELLTSGAAIVPHGEITLTGLGAP